MGLSIFSRSIDLSASPEALFAFHEDPGNISRIAPPGLSVLRVEAAGRALPGERFRLVVKQFFFTLDWEGEWESVERPRRLVDVGVRCPLKFWRHSHLFEPVPGGARMTDRVEYELPGGVSGRVLAETVVRLALGAMFASRHAATGALFGVL